MKSLDPRVNRLPFPIEAPPMRAKAPLDQFGTFEVFVQPREGKPFQHEGAVHAPDLELAFVLAKETFTRRFTCTSLFVADTRTIFVSAMTEGNQSVYDTLGSATPIETGNEPYEIFHLLKRGKQHIHAGTVNAGSPDDALRQAHNTLRPNAVVYNLWAVRQGDIRFTTPEEKTFWDTLPDKKFRDAIAYKAGDKLKDFLEKR